MARPAQHADVRPGAKNPILAGPQHHRLDFRVLEAQPLDGVVELDVDAEIVGIELQLIPFEQARRLIDIHDEFGNLTIKGEFPMAVARRVDLKVNQHAGRL